MAKNIASLKLRGPVLIKILRVSKICTLYHAPSTFLSPPCGYHWALTHITGSDEKRISFPRGMGDGRRGGAGVCRGNEVKI
jgi:hypothetical protein